LDDQWYLQAIADHHDDFSTALSEVATALRRLVRACHNIDQGRQEHRRVRNILGRWLDRLVGLWQSS